MNRIEELENIILCYQHQEKEYLDFIEGLELDIKTFKNGMANMKSQKEELDIALKNTKKFYNDAIVKRDKKNEELENTIKELKEKLSLYECINQD